MFFLNLTGTQLLVFTLTYLCMVSSRASREVWYMIKPELETSMDFSSVFLGTIDTIFLFTYSVGFFLSGMLADKFNPTTILACSMCTGMLGFWIISLLGAINLTENYIFAIIWAIEGISQGFILTIAVSLMSNWFPAEIRGAAMGFWGSNAGLGNIVGEWIDAGIQDLASLPWEAAILVSGTFLGSIGLLVKAFINEKPQAFSQSLSLLHAHKPLTFLEAWKVDGVLFCSLAYACIKLVNYGFFMWLPYYLSSEFGLGLTKISFLATLYDLASILGTMTTGYITDRIKFRSVVVEAMILASLPVIIGFLMVDMENSWILYCLIPASGLLVGGSSSAMSSLIAADLSIDEETKESRATVIGIINGTGSLGSAVGQYIV